MDKVKLLEDNANKNIIRTETTHQAIQFIKQIKKKDITITSLCGDKWHWENMLQTNAKLNNIKTKLNFIGVESEGKIALEALKCVAIPDNYTLIKGNFHYSLTKQLIKLRNNLYVTNDEKENVKCDSIDIMYTDYCGIPNKELIRNNAWYIAEILKENGMYLTTYRIQSRKIGGNKKLARAFNCSYNKISDKIISDLIKETKKYNKKIKLNLVYKKLYMGGGSSSSNMLTIAIVKGKHNKITPIIEDIRTDENLIKRRCIVAQLKLRSAKSRFKPKKIGRKLKKNIKRFTLRTTEEQRNKIKNMLLRGWKPQTIVNKLNVSRGSVGSVQAHITMNTYK